MAGIVPGVYAITATPFDDQGRVDEDSIASLVEFEIKAGVHGLNVLGIMGEAHKLTEGERRRVAELFLKYVGGRVPVVVGTTHPGVIPATELSREAEAQGASAVMVAPPSGLKTPEAILAHYRAVAAAMRIPVVVQDEPVTTGVLMPASLLARIAEEIESCRIIKLEEAPTPPKVTQIRKLAGSSVKIFGGLGGAYFFEELSRGADGIMTGFAFPEILVEIYGTFTAGRRGAAATIFDRYASLIRYEAQQGIGLALRKEILRKRGAIRTAVVRAPGPAMDEVTRRELDDILQRMGVETTGVSR
ncbi:MAG: dihydrodipicolinate synthase family protein [Candidatus Methylomirabilota bacterium]